MKKVISLLLAALMLFALCACGSSANTPAADTAKTDTAKTDTGKTDTAKTPAATEAPKTPADDGKVYTLTYASTASEGNPLWELNVKPILEAITEATNGRIQFEVYHNGSLAGFGEILKGLQTGVCDMGNDSVNNYPGVYPYYELMGAPGVYFGETLDEKIDNLFAYSQKYTAPAYEAQGIYLIGEVPGVPVYLYTTKPIEKTSDLASRTFATSNNYAPMVTSFGASASNVIPAEQYEAVRLNVIDSIINGAGPLQAFRLYEVLDYAYELPFATVFNQIFMSKRVYDELPADLQEALDNFRFSEQYKQLAKNFVTSMMDTVVSACKEGNPDFQFLSLPDEVSKDMMAACDEQIEATLQRVRDAGLDADGAKAMLDSFKK